jgi:methylated-DNA-protein-cysteine methyltransferase-like protein
MVRSDFYKDVYDIVRLIPRGRVTSYGAIAACLGAKSGARMVGYAMNAAHEQIPGVPAHRVVNRNGLLSGKHHFGPGNEMKELLESEGIEVENDQIKNFRSAIWSPLENLSL